MAFQPGNKHAIGGRKEKPFRDALRLAIAEAENNPRSLRKVAEQLVDKAIAGDVPAIKEIADRLDGKVPQAHEHAGAGGGPIQTVDLSRATDEQLTALEALFGPLAVAAGDDESDQDRAGAASS